MDDVRLKRFRSVPGTWWNTPKELWGFRLKAPGAPATAAQRLLRDNAGLLGTGPGARGLQLVRTIHSLGATHLLFQQRHRGVAIHRAYVTVHVALSGEIYLVKNRAVPAALLPKADVDFTMSVDAARRRALGSVGAAKRVEARPPVRRWYPDAARLRPTFRFRVLSEHPRREWLIYVDARTGALVHKYDNLANATAHGLVFDPNPVADVAEWRSLLSPRGRPRKPPEEAYHEVTLRRLAAGRRLDGAHATTRPTERRIRRAELPRKCVSGEGGFLETMAYYHVDRAVAWLESLGYRGRRAIFPDPIAIDAHGTTEDNSWYSPELRRLTFGTGGVDDAEDAEVILHELGHAIQDAICPDFGQSPEAAAMGEGFGDYLAASFFAARKPAALRPCVMSWDSIASADGGLPCERRLDSRLTYESFDHAADADEHDNGTIWSATLWDIWNAVGRDTADRLVIESHFQLDAFTSFARGARAILDADRNLFHGRHGAALRRVFHARGIGPVE